MHKCRRDVGLSTLNASGWYQLYFAAVTEANESRAVLEIERARQAMRNRLAELQGGELSDGGEIQDLKNAMTYLAILLRHVGRGGGHLIWS